MFHTALSLSLLSCSGRVGCPHPGADGLLMLNGNYDSELQFVVFLLSVICSCSHLENRPGNLDVCDDVTCSYCTVCF